MKLENKTMPYLSRVAHVMALFDNFLSIFQRLLQHQELLTTTSLTYVKPLELVKQMLLAQKVAEERQRDLRESLQAGETDRFIHELWSLGSDTTHFDFDFGPLKDTKTFFSLRQELSLAALQLTKDLTDKSNRSAFALELALQRLK